MVAVAPQVFEDFDFLTGKGEFFGAAGAGVFAEVHAQAAGNELAFVFHGLTAATEHGVDTGQEHRNGERLRNVVVSTVLEAVDDVVIGVLSRKDDNREALVLFANLVANRKAVHAGEHQVQKNKVILLGEGFGKAAFAVGAVLNVVTVQLAEVDQTFSNGNFIFDDKNFSGASIFSRHLFYLGL